MVKIKIDPGHGGTDPGAVGNGLQEKNLTLQISKRIRDMLLEYENTQVSLTREGDQTLSLNQRTDMANEWGADFILSIHINASGGTGYEDYRYNKLSPSSPTGKIQSHIHAGVMEEISKFGVRDRGAKAANFHMLRESNMPAVLSENLFIDTTADANLLKQPEFIEALARGHVNGLVKAFSLKKKTSSKVVSTKTMSVLIQTGGLGYNDIQEVAKFCLERKWAFSIDYDGKGNPKALVGRLNTKRQREFENWLKDKNWWYKVID